MFDFYDAMGAVDMYALRYGVTHLCQNRESIKKARALMFRFDWLLQRALLGPVHELVLDASCVKTAIGPEQSSDHAFALLHSALRGAQPGLAESPWQLAGQLVNRLQGYADPCEDAFYVEEVETFVDTVRAWDEYDWWCALGQTYHAAGGDCVATLVGHSGDVLSLIHI